MRDAGGVDRHVAALPNGRDSRAELPQHPGRALHVGSGQQAFELARAARQPRQHHGAVGDALISWRTDDPVYLHASACRRHCAARLSHAVTARAFPVSSARSSSPSGSSRERSAGSNSSRFMRKISVQSAGSEAASRVASRAPGPNVAPGGAASARQWARRDATACGRWLVSASWWSCCAAAMRTGCASSTLSQKCETSLAAPSPSRVAVMYTIAPLNRSARAAAKPCACVPASGWSPPKRGPMRSPSARATIARFTEPTSVTSAPAPMCGSRVTSSWRLAAGGAASTSSSTARATSTARGGASSIAPCRTAATRSPGSGDQPSTVAIPARFACRASEPPIAPRPRMPSLVGRTQRKLAATHGGVNAKGGSARAAPHVATGGAGAARALLRDSVRRGEADYVVADVELATDRAGRHHILVVGPHDSLIRTAGDERQPTERERTRVARDDSRGRIEARERNGNDSYQERLRGWRSGPCHGDLTRPGVQTGNLRRLHCAGRIDREGGTPHDAADGCRRRVGARCGDGWVEHPPHRARGRHAWGLVPENCQSRAPV